MKRCWRLLSFTALSLCCVLLGTWAVGRLLSDRFLWSQYITWIPAVVIVPAAIILWLNAVGAARLSGAHRIRWMNRLVGVGLLVAVMHLAVIDLRLYRLPFRSAPTGAHLKIMHWNINGIDRMESITAALAEQKPDVAILVNPFWTLRWKEFPRAIDPAYHVVDVGGFSIVSKVPVLRYGMETLGLEGLPPESTSRRKWPDPGRAVFVELDTTEQLGRSCVVWGIDLPSEPQLSRWKLVHEAAEHLRSWRDPDMRGPAGFPAPDVVVGDFNIVRGSASLSVLLPGMRNAFDEAGAGYAATWPTRGFRTPIPLVQIDQMFLGPRVQAARYELFNPGVGYHMFQVGGVTGK